MSRYKWIYIAGTAVLAVFISGCRYIVSEPYPGFLISTIPPSQIPTVVRDAFSSSYPNAVSERVETLSFNGKVDFYRIYFRIKEGETTNAIFRCSGSLVSGQASFPPLQYQEGNK
jgi:hypothetical protein